MVSSIISKTYWERWAESKRGAWESRTESRCFVFYWTDYSTQNNQCNCASHSTGFHMIPNPNHKIAVTDEHSGQTHTPIFSQYRLEITTLLRKFELISVMQSLQPLFSRSSKMSMRLPWWALKTIKAICSSPNCDSIARFCIISMAQASLPKRVAVKPFDLAMAII